MELRKLLWIAAGGFVVVMLANAVSDSFASFLNVIFIWSVVLSGITLVGFVVYFLVNSSNIGFGYLNDADEPDSERKPIQAAVPLALEAPVAVSASDYVVPSVVDAEPV